MKKKIIRFFPYYRSGWPHRPLGSHRYQAGQWCGRQPCPRPRSTRRRRPSGHGPSMADTTAQHSHFFQLDRSEVGVRGLGQPSALYWVVPRRPAHIAKSTRDQNGYAQRISGLSSLPVSKVCLLASTNPSYDTKVRCVEISFGGNFQETFLDLNYNFKMRSN